MTAEQAIALLASLRDRFPSQRIPDASMKAYAEDLLDLDLDPARRAITRVGREENFWPSVGRIRRAYAEIVLAPPDTSEAFNEASEGEVEQMNPLIYRARRRVGDRSYWRTTDRRELRYAFREAYEEVVEGAIREIVMGESPTLAALPVSEEIRRIHPTDEV